MFEDPKKQALYEIFLQGKEGMLAEAHAVQRTNVIFNSLALPEVKAFIKDLIEE